MKFFQLIALTFTISIGVPISNRPVLSSPVRHIPASLAQGLEETIAQVKIYSDGNTVINFRPLGERVRQVTLGDDSRIFLSSDDPDCLSNAQGPHHSLRRCTATILYLQKKPTTSNKAALLTTRMTALTDNNIYIFEVVLANRRPEYTVLEIQPASISSSAPTLTSIEETEILLLGFQAALHQSYIVDPELSHRIHNFLFSVRNGKNISDSAMNAGLSMAVVQKLEELGRVEKSKQTPHSDIKPQQSPSQSPTKQEGLGSP